MTKRKSPVRHVVKSHRRETKKGKVSTVRDFVRGKSIVRRAKRHIAKILPQVTKSDLKYVEGLIKKYGPAMLSIEPSGWILPKPTKEERRKVREIYKRANYVSTNPTKYPKEVVTLAREISEWSEEVLNI